MKRGRFIALEGIDGSGTTTQSKLLVQKLNASGIKAIRTAEPTDGPIGKLLRQMLADKEDSSQWQHPTMALLFAADRLHHLKTIVEPALSAGQWVITDRYALSSLVYQGNWLPGEWIQNLNQFAIVPDLTIVLDIGIAQASARRQSRGTEPEIFEHDEIQRKLKDSYLACASKLSAIVVNGAGTLEEVTDRLWQVMPLQ